MLRLLCALLFIAALSGCGQSGPLYLPGDPSEIRSVPPEPTEEEDTEDDGDGSTR